MVIKLILIKMKQTTPTQKGLLTGALMILASLFSLYVLKNPVDSYFRYIIYTIYCTGIIWSLISYSKSANNKKSITNYFSIAFKTFVITTLMIVTFTYIYFSFHVEFRDNMIAENSRLLRVEGHHLPREIDEFAVQSKKMFLTGIISVYIFGYLVMGAVVSLITAGFLSKKSTTA